MSSNRFCPCKIQKSCRKKCTVHYGGGWIGVWKSADPLWFIDLLTKSAAKILPASEIRAKTLLLPAKSKIRAQKMAESAIRWNYRIRESVKISLWIRNPGKNISKIRRSVHLFTPLLRMQIWICNRLRHARQRLTDCKDLFMVFTWRYQNSN